MQKYFLRLFFNACFWLVGCDNVRAQIIPVPQKYTPQAGELRLEKSASVVLVNDIPEESALTAAEVVNEAFKDYLKLPTTFETDPKRALVHLIRITEEQALAYQIPANKIKGAYRLRIETTRITIESVHPIGLFYGATTLAQIIEQSKDKKLKAVEIIDWADFEQRGISDDISRGQIHTFQRYKKVIRELARYKQNVLALYIEDALELESYSEIGVGRPKLTKKEVANLVIYGKKYYVELIPIVETLGHQENILNLKPFQRLAEFTGAMSFCVTEPLVYEYLDKILKEIGGLFPSNYIHIGGDESFDVGVGRSKLFAQQMGLPALHLQHYRKVANICRKYNKKPMLYGDMLLKYPEILPQLANDFTIVDWQYQTEEEYASTIKFERAGLPYWVSPSVHNYESVFPVHTDALANIQNLAKAGKAHHATGLLTSNWGDMGNESPKDLLYFLYAFSGACGWNIEKVDVSEVHKQFFRQFFRSNNLLAGNTYSLLANPALGVTWQEFWRHPLSPVKKPPTWQPPLDLLAKKKYFDWQLPIIKQSMDSLRKQIHANFEMIEAWDITHTMLVFYGQKIALQNRLIDYKNASDKEKEDIKKREDIKEREANKQKFLKDTISDKEELLNNLKLRIDKNRAYMNLVKEELLKDLEAIVIDLQSVQTRYEQFWLKYYKPEGLEAIKLKFNNLIASFQDTKDLMLYDYEINVLIPSKWIYANAKTETPQPYTIFKRKLLLTEIPISATMQIIADSYAEVYVNGELIDSVYTRNIFSAHLEPKLVKWIDIKDKIGNDENKPVDIMIKAHNFNEGLQNLLPNSNINTSAGINVFIRLQGLENETLFYSDESWEYVNSEEDQIIKPVKIQSYRFDIIMPNFQQNRPSWIER